MNRVLDEMILTGVSLVEVRNEAKKYGYIPIAEDGIGKILEGHISLESLGRSVDLTDRM